MTRRVLQIGLPLIILGVGLFGGYWLITHRNQVAPAPTAPLKPRVEYIVAQMRDYTPVIRSQGIARPRGQTLLSPELSGRLTHVSGSLVNGALLDSGTVLARIDDADFKLALRTADADLETARAGVTNAIAQVSSGLATIAQVEARIAREEAEAEAAKSEWLLLGRQGDPPPLLIRIPQLKEARAALAAAQAAANSAQAQIKSYQAAEKAALAKSDLAKLNIDKCVITAPYPCRVSEVRVDQGQIVSPATVMAILQRLDYAEIRLPLTLDEIQLIDLPNALKGGSSAVDGPKVILISGKDRWNGNITRGEGALDQETLTTSLIAKIDSPYDASPTALTFGRFVEAEIHGRLMNDIVMVPAKALREGNAVYLLRDGTLRRRDVTILHRTHDQIIVGHGLENGDRVCTTTLDTFVEGMPVLTTNTAEQQEDE